MPDELEKYLADIESVSEEVREKAIVGLSQFSDLQALVALKKAAREDENLRLRQLARKCLLDLKKTITSVAPDLSSHGDDRHLNIKRLKYYLASNDTQARLNAVKSTVAFKDRRIIGILNAHVSEETDPVVKGATLLAMGIVGKAEVIPTLSALLKKEKDPLVQKAIIEGLSYTGDINVYPIILKSFVTEADALVQRACIKALHKLGRDNLMRLLGRMVQSSRVWRRAVAVRALGRFNSSSVIPMLEAALVDEEEEVRQLAQKSLVRLARHGNPRAREIVETLKIKTEGPSREMPDEAEIFGGSTTIRLDDGDPNVRLACIEAYVGSGDMAKFPQLKDRLKVETHDYVKAALVTAIYRLAGRASVPVLKDCLKDPIDRVRANAVEGLSKVGDDANYPLFIQMLKDKDPRTRANAIVALKKCNYVDPVRYIEQMVESADERMVRSAIHAMVEIASEKAIALLADLAEHENQGVREKAVESLEILKERGNTAARKQVSRLARERHVAEHKANKARRSSPAAGVEPAEVGVIAEEIDVPPPAVPEDAATDEEPPHHVDPPADPLFPVDPIPATSAPAVLAALEAPPTSTPVRVEPRLTAQPPPVAAPVTAPPPVATPSRPPAPREVKPPAPPPPPISKPNEKPQVAPPQQGFKLPFDVSQGFSRATLDSFLKWLERLPAAWRVALIALLMVWGMVFLMLIIQFIRGDE